jgi:molybdenum cofactor cytidylyltransferase
MNIIGLLLAAGRGRRMGGNKQFHLVETPTGEKPLIAAAFDTIAPVCDWMIVVLGHRAEEAAAALGQRKFEIVTSDPDAQMIVSIKAGLRAALSRRATPSGNILLQLGDHPALEPATLDMLLTVATENSDRAVILTYHGDGGHPVLIPAAIAEQILSAECPGGLRQFWLDDPELCLRIPVEDLSIILDLDESS